MTLHELTQLDVAVNTLKVCKEGVARVLRKDAASPPLAERVQAALTDEVLMNALDTFDNLYDKARARRYALTDEKALSLSLDAMRAVLLAALAPRTEQP